MIFSLNTIMLATDINNIEIVTFAMGILLLWYIHIYYISTYVHTHIFLLYVNLTET